MQPVRRFFVADLNVKGELQTVAEYRYEHLEQIPGAADLIATCSSWVWRSPEEFETSLHPSRRHLSLRWRAAAPTAGIATVRNKEQLASVSLLCSGLNAEADKLTLQAYQGHLSSELRDTGVEPGFDLIGLKQRPLVATINFAGPSDQTDQLLVALADRCFGAAYFRYLSLA